MWVVADRVRETTTTTGTGDVTLAGAVSGFQALSAVCANGDNVFYAIVNRSAAEWEVGFGTWNTGGTLTRGYVLASSSAGAAVSFSAGTKDVFVPKSGMEGSYATTRRLADVVDHIIPPQSSSIVTSDYEISSGQVLELMADGILEIT
jgi:hypothetical protein